ncbi:hypothetical protein Tco_0099874 [Tanacetum coccineum]
MALSPSYFRRGRRSRSEESEDEGPDSEGEEAAHEGQQQQAASVEVIIADRPLGLGYEAARRHALDIAEEITPNTFEFGQSYRSAPDQQIEDETPTPRIPAHITWIDPEDGTVYLDIKIDPFILCTRSDPEISEWSGVVREEIHSQHFRLGSLERPQEQATITFDALCQPVLALEAWAGHTDPQRVAMWQA